MLLRNTIIFLFVFICISCSYDKNKNVSIVPTQTSNINITPSTTTSTSTRTTTSSTSIITQNWVIMNETFDYTTLTGSITENGIYISDKNGYVEYITKMRQAIIVEFDVRGLRTYDINNEEEAKLVFIQVYDGSIDTIWVGGSSAWSQQHLIEVRKKNPQFRMKGGGGCEDCYDIEQYLENQIWNPELTYHIILKIELGKVSFYQDNILLYEGESKYFIPLSTLNVRIGGGRQDLGIPQMYYSNIKIYGLVNSTKTGLVNSTKTGLVNSTKTGKTSQ